MKKSLSILITLCMMLSLFSGLIVVTKAAAEYKTVVLNGFTNWTQAELDTSSGNNGYANACCTALTVVTDAQYIVGGGKQAIKAVYGGSSTAYNNCIVNWKYGTGGPCTAGNVWAPADGSSVNYASYDGIRVAVLNAKGEPANFNKITFRVTHDKNYGYNMRFWEGTPVRDEQGYFYFDFASFTTDGSPTGTDIYDYLKNNAEGISMLCYGGNDEKTCYYSAVELYRDKNIDFSKLEKAINTMKANNTDGKYDREIAAAEALLNGDETIQADVDAAVVALNPILREILLKPVEFNEDNIVLSFGAVSDIHIQGSVTDPATKKYTNALQKLKKFAGGKLDAITIAGDLSNSYYFSGIGTAFKQVTDAELGENANVFFISGNHDAQNGEWSRLNQFYTDLAKYTTDDLPSSQLDRGNRHKVINGYHYIGINMMEYWNAAEAKFDTQDLDWLAAELEAARAAAPGQPIFVYVHAGIYGTTYGSDLHTSSYWGSKSIYSYLENYPEVVTFSGHVHFPLADQRTIYQKDFTSLNCGSVQYMAIENGYLQSGNKTTVAESTQVSSGLLVQVDNNNNIKITRLDFANDKIIKEPLYISAPDLENKSNLLHYNDDYFNLDNTAPVFGADADVFGVQSGANMEVTFPAAADNDMVHHYLIEIKGLSSGVKKSVKAFSEFYLYPTAEDFPDEYTFRIPFTPGTEGEDVEITVCAVDSMGLRSEPLVFNPNLVDPPAIVTQPADVTVHQGNEATVTIEATGKGLTYKWYYRNKDTSNFILDPDYAEATYSVKMQENVDGRQVYCKVTDKYGHEVDSNTATLTMQPDCKFTNYVSNNDATCTANGTETGKCTCGAKDTREVANSKKAHTSDKGTVTKKATCTATGIKTYKCTVCKTTLKSETVAKIAHSYKTTTTKATTSKNGKIVKACSVCGKVYSTKTIYYAKKVKLSTTEYTYSSSKTRKPSVKVYDYKGNKISSSYYTVSYASGRKNVGKYKVTIKFKGNYSGTLTAYFTINPKIKLSTTEYTYNGKAKKPTVKVTDSSGKKISTKYYTVSYSSGRKKVGKYTVTIKFKNGHSGTYKKTFTIVPKESKVSSISAAKKSLKVKISKVSSESSGYEIQYSTSKTFKSKYTKTKKVTSYKTTSVTLKSLKAKKTYYVRVRTYKTVDGKKYYSDWSSKKTKKTK